MLYMNSMNIIVHASTVANKKCIFKLIIRENIILLSTGVIIQRNAQYESRKDI